MTAASPERRTRRAVLAAAVGTVAATAASAVHAPRVLGAGSDGAPMAIGGQYDPVYSTTSIHNAHGAGSYSECLSLSSDHGFGLYALGDLAGVFGSSPTAGVHGHSDGGSGTGVLGQYGYPSAPVLFAPTAITGITYAAGTTAGVLGWSYGDGAATVGVMGQSDNASVAYGVYGLASASSTSTQGVGVYGHAKSAKGGVGTYGWAESATGTTYGVIGQVQSPTGIGVYGFAPTGGTAVRATSTGGVALHTSGRVVVDKVSGVATIAAGTSSITVKPGIVVSTKAFALLTPKADLGTRRLWYTTSPTAGTVTIRVSSAVTVATQIGWLLLG